jgi:hypothetical protein
MTLKHEYLRDSIMVSTGTPQFQKLPESMRESPWSDYQKENFDNGFGGIITNSPNNKSCKE